MVFFNSCLSVKYHHELLNYIDLPVMCIHVSAYLNLASVEAGIDTEKKVITMAVLIPCIARISTGMISIG